jgi:hypothetical protein
MTAYPFKPQEKAVFLMAIKSRRVTRKNMTGMNVYLARRRQLTEQIVR